MHKKVAIKYGIGEGDYHGRAFVAALKRAGFEVVRDDHEADIVVTHSGGCFFLPPLELNQTFVLINPPYWPGKWLVVSTWQKVSRDFIDFARDGKLPQWCWKTIINLVHIMRYILKTLTITLHAHRKRFYDALDEHSTTIIRNDSDTFLSPNADKLLHEKAGRSFKFVRLPGQHDACWRNPEPYIEIIKSAAGH